LTFFFDNNLSPRLAAGLRAFGEDVRHLREEFPPETPDEVWLPEIGRRGWYLITRDKRIPRKAAEVRALKAAGVGAFVFTQKKDLDLWEWVQTVVRRWSEIKNWCQSHRRPFVVGIPERGTLRPM
jgi:hypothetical protein